MTIKRFLPSAGLAIAMTTAIGLFMVAMVATEFQPQDKHETLNYEINPVVVDIDPPHDRIPPVLIQRVETPPPPPVIAREEAAQPREKLTTVDGRIPVFDPPKLDHNVFVITVSDRDAQPLVRIPPIMPPRAEKSGHCRVRFDVSPEGAPFNVVATYCTQKLFERASTKSVQKWKYNPKIVDGRSVSRSGVESKISFRLTDERGKIIPE